MSECFFDNRVKEAVYIGSSDLYKELEKLFNSKVKDEDRKNGIEISFMKYLSRMSTRCTPFGLFATSSMGNVGEVTQFSLDDEQVHSIGYVLSVRIGTDYIKFAGCKKRSIILSE